MGLLDKLKNVFFEEEEIEVEEKPKKTKPLVKKVETPKKENKKEEKKEEKVKEEEVKEEDVEQLEENNDEEESFVSEADKDFKFPVILDEEEETFEEEIEYPEETMYKEVERENNIYGGNKSDRLQVDYESDYHQEPYSNSYTRDLNSTSYSLMDRKEVKAFKPSPVISPVYGVLDKNYTSDEIKEKNKNERKDPPVFSFSSTKLDLDSVRAKAYGVTDEVPHDDVQEIEDDIEVNNNDTLDMTDTDMKPVVDSVTVGDAEEYFEDLGLEYNVDYKDSTKKTRVKKKEQEEIEEKENEEVIADKPKRRSKPKEENDIDIEDNLFDLIDSMYDEGE